MICALLPPLLMTDYITLKACLLEEVNTNDWWPLAQLLIAWLRLNSFVYIVSQSLHKSLSLKNRLKQHWQCLGSSFRLFWCIYSHGLTDQELFYSMLQILFTSQMFLWQDGQMWLTSLKRSIQKGIRQHPARHLCQKQNNDNVNVLYSDTVESVLSSLIACLADWHTERNSLNNEEQLFNNEQYNIYMWGIIQVLVLESDLPS